LRYACRSMNEGELESVFSKLGQNVSRREFVEKGTVAVGTLAFANILRTLFVGKTTLSSDSSTIIETQLSNEQKILNEMLRNALNRMIVLDIGKRGESGVQAFSDFEMWQILSGNGSTDRVKYDELVDRYEKNRSEVSQKDRAILQFSWMASHGQVVTNALSLGAEQIYKTEALAKELPFIPYTPDLVIGSETLQLIDRGEVVIDSGEYRLKGKRFELIINPPPEHLPEEKVISASLQMGSVFVDVWEELGSRINIVLSHSDLRLLFKNTGNSTEKYYKEDFGATYILPKGKTLENVSRILVRKEGEEDYLPFDVSLTATELSQDESHVLINSETALIEYYKLVLDDGTEIDPKYDPNSDNFDFSFEKDERLSWRDPEMHGAYSLVNPKRGKNIEILRQFLSEHPNNFFVMATGNYEDVLIDEDFPENLIFAGQAMMGMFGKPAGGFGEVAVANAIYSEPSELGVPGNGSSLVTPIIALLASQVWEEANVQPTRASLQDFLVKKDSLLSYDLIPNSLEVKPWKMKFLDLDAVKNWIRERSFKELERRSEKLRTSTKKSRRGLLQMFTGKHD